jgi:hypothetical protein
MQIAVDETLLNDASQAFGLSPNEAAEKGLRLMLMLLNHQELLEDLEDIEDVQQITSELNSGQEALVAWSAVKSKAGL